jgi:hypothetical protein
MLMGYAYLWISGYGYRCNVFGWMDMRRAIFLFGWMDSQANAKVDERREESLAHM